MTKKQMPWILWIHILLIVLALVLLASLVLSDPHTPVSEPVSLTLSGTYSLNGGQWCPLEEDTSLNAGDGTIVIRGKFSSDILEGENINLYLNHVAFSLSVNGTLVAQSDTWDTPKTRATCYETWASVISPGIKAEDEIELQLQNLHGTGNTRAYNEALSSLCVADGATLREYLRGESLLWRVTGLIIIGFSLAIMGIALSFFLIKVPHSQKFGVMGVMSLFAGIWITLNTLDISQWTRLELFNSYLPEVAALLFMFELGLLIHMSVSDTVKRITAVSITAEAMVILAILVSCLIARIRIYELLSYWLVFQFVIGFVLLGCCIFDGVKRREEKPALLWLCALMLLGILTDLVNLRFGWWDYGLVARVLFIVLFLILVVRGIERISVNYRTSYQMDKLEADLKNSRIVAAMSQIRTHFVFNILNAISGMCKYDPEQADQTVVRFSRYLRTNINILQEDNLVDFQSALQHLEDYIILEQVRFGDKVIFKKDIGVDDFMIPPLILQPIVENAIKHGLRPKPDGGTITLRTRREEHAVCISIRDDGVGFDTNAEKKTESVGISNVSFRVQQLIGGSLHIESEPGKGTTVTILVPCEEEQA